MSLCTAGAIVSAAAALAALLFTLTSQLVIMFEPTATIDIYQMPEHFPVWGKLMMPDIGPPPATFFLMSVLVSFALALIYAVVFRIVAPGIQGEGITKGLSYGLILSFYQVSRHSLVCSCSSTCPQNSLFQ